MSDTRTKAMEIYMKHIALASVDGRQFRRLVMDEIIEVCGVSRPSSATHYNNCKKANPIEGLGRAPSAKGTRKITVGKNVPVDMIPDEECFSVIELIGDDGDKCVGRTRTHVLQGDASEDFDSKVKNWPHSTWVLIQGLGPNTGDRFILEPEEKELKRYTSATTWKPNIPLRVVRTEETEI